MSFRNFVSEAEQKIRSACHSLKYEYPEQLEWDVPPSRELGDLSFRTGYQLSRVARKRPADIVSEIAEEITKELTSMKYVESVEGHPSGFLNFKFNRKNFFQDVLDAAQKLSYGSLDIGKSSSVLVEHTSVNPNKALHVGHLRNVALGDSISRIFRFTNHNVKVLNYIDDSGLQVADVIVGIKYLGFPKESNGKKFDHYAGDDIYVSVNKKYEIDSTLAQKRTSVLRAIEGRDKEIFPLAFEITNKILSEQLKTCWRFNAFYDLLVFESDIIESRLWQEVFDALKKQEIAKLETDGEFKGCWIVTVKGEKEGEDKVLVRSDGTATYIAKDIPFAALKMGIIQDKFSYDEFALQPDQRELLRTRASEERIAQSPVAWGAERSITAIGSEQSRLQRVILHILEQLSGKDLSQKYIHLGYALMTLSPSTVAS
ncbi:MAG: arginine--tRNA ligase, partial [Nitrososphaerota archaeon]|nr:arginine--tRNA ligase [Nitrososphaerota archaeon]